VLSSENNVKEYIFFSSFTMYKIIGFILAAWQKMMFTTLLARHNDTWLIFYPTRAGAKPKL